MDISVILCTYKRAESLRRTLNTCCELKIPSGVTWELLVVDNNSTDATKEACVAFTGKLPIRYLFEPKAGKSHALNTGIQSAQAPLLVFTDDDVDVDQNWLASFLDAAQRHKDAVFFGGKVLPQWESPPPHWMARHSANLISGVTVHLDLGDQERLLPDDGSSFFGANMAVRKKIFDSGHRFREDLGPKGGHPVRGEETELIHRLLRQGCQGVYLPTVLVHHRNSPDRMTECYVRHWYIGYGMKEVRLGHVAVGKVTWWGAPRYLWRQLLSNTFKYAVTRWTCSSDTWLPAEIRMATTWGTICEFRRSASLGELQQ